MKSFFPSFVKGLLHVIINQLSNNYFKYLKQGVDDFVGHLVVDQVHGPAKKKRRIGKDKSIITVSEHIVQVFCELHIISVNFKQQMECYILLF